MALNRAHSPVCSFSDARQSVILFVDYFGVVLCHLLILLVLQKSRPRTRGMHALSLSWHSPPLSHCGWLSMSNSIPACVIVRGLLRAAFHRRSAPHPRQDPALLHVLTNEPRSIREVRSTIDPSHLRTRAPAPAEVSNPFPCCWASGFCCVPYKHAAHAHRAGAGHTSHLAVGFPSHVLRGPT